jgi:hypothetical protein
MIVQRTPIVGLLWPPLVLAAAIGCSDTPLPSDAAGRPLAAPGVTVPVDPQTTATPAPERETWDVLTMQGKRIGYGHATTAPATLSGRKLVRFEAVQYLETLRFGQKTAQEIRATSLETPAGELVQCETEIGQRPGTIQVSGRVVGDRLEVKVSSAGKTVAGSIPWKPSYGGFDSLERSLRQRPMQPGERRTVGTLEPAPDQIIPVTVELHAQRYESVDLWTGSGELLRIEVQSRYPDGTRLPSTLWTDRLGEPMKHFSPAMQLSTYRVAKAVALEEFEPGGIDLGWDIAVKLDRPLENPHDTNEVRYRIRFEGGDPAAVFASGPSQRVTAVDPHTAEVTVYAVRPGREVGNAEAPADPPTDADRRPNSYIQSDDPRIVTEASEAAGGRTDPWETAVALEKHVCNVMTEKNFSQAFRTAAEVAQSHEGDCTEHAVFLAALARARGIPARVAFGLVYLAPRQSFFYHMWTEVYVDGRWIPLDATLGKGGIGAAHLKLGHSNLQGTSAYSGFLAVAQVIGRLTIERL